MPYLSEHVPLWIAQMRLHKGIPSNVIPDGYSELTKEQEDECIERWDQILDIIVEGFESARKISEDDLDCWDEFWDEYDKQGGDTEDDLSFNHSNPNSIWNSVMRQLNTREKEELERKELMEKFHKGMDLFKEYYFNLWW